MTVPSRDNFNTVSGNGGNISLTNPTGTSNEEVLVAFIQHENTAVLFATATGWTAHSVASQGGGEPQVIQAFTREWETGDPTSHSFTWADFAAREAIIINVSGTQLGDWVGNNVVNNGSSSTATYLAITASTTDYLQIGYMSNWQWATMATPTTWSLITTIGNASHSHDRTAQDVTASTSTIGTSSGWATSRIIIRSPQAAGGRIMGSIARYGGLAGKGGIAGQGGGLAG